MAKKPHHSSKPTSPSTPKLLSSLENQHRRKNPRTSKITPAATLPKVERHLTPRPAPKMSFRLISQAHFTELNNIWDADRRIPTAASRRAWSLARNLSPEKVNAWWYRRKVIAKRYRIKIPKDTYELPVGIPPVIEDEDDKSGVHWVKEEPLDPAMDVDTNERSNLNVTEDALSKQIKREEIESFDPQWSSPPSDGLTLVPESSDTICIPSSSSPADPNFSGSVPLGHVIKNCAYTHPSVAISESHANSEDSHLDILMEIETDSSGAAPLLGSQITAIKGGQGPSDSRTKCTCVLCSSDPVSDYTMDDDSNAGSLTLESLFLHHSTVLEQGPSLQPMQLSAIPFLDHKVAPESSALSCSQSAHCPSRFTALILWYILDGQLYTRDGGHVGAAPSMESICEIHMLDVTRCMGSPFESIELTEAAELF